MSGLLGRTLVIMAISFFFIPCLYAQPLYEELVKPNANELINRLNKLMEEVQNIKEELESLKNKQKELETEQDKKEEDLWSEIDYMDDRIMKSEVKTALDRVNFYGDFRADFNTIQAHIPKHNQMYNTPKGLSSIQKGAHWYRNNKLFTHRLRLNMTADIADNIKFRGRLSALKAFGVGDDAPIFNGQATGYYFDGNAARRPSSGRIYLERAYVDWSDIGGYPIFFSVGRRPSTDGPPLHLKLNSPRQGTPPAIAFDFPFDGMTLGMGVSDYVHIPGSVVRICYGIGYDSGWGDGDLLDDDSIFRNVSADALRDMDLIGILWDVWDDPDEGSFLNILYARSFNISDVMAGTGVFPYALDPLTGESLPNPETIKPIQRFSPTQTIGDMDIAAVTFMHRDFNTDWFLASAWNHSHPDSNAYSKYGFGGFLTDQGQPLKGHSGWAVFTGFRRPWSIPYLNLDTKYGLEYNFGSKYWFNFTHGADNIFGSKLAARGHVVEPYLILDINKNAYIRLSYQYYHYLWSGSGWHVGSPQKLSSNPSLMFPTPDRVHVFTTSLNFKF